MQPLALNRRAVAAVLGSEQIRRQLERYGELKPFYRRASFTLYDWPDVVRAYTRFRMGQTGIPLTPEDGGEQTATTQTAVTNDTP